MVIGILAIRKISRAGRMGWFKYLTHYAAGYLPGHQWLPSAHSVWNKNAPFWWYER